MGWLILVTAAIFFGLGTYMGAPYLPLRKKEANKVLNALGLKSGQVLIDLGSGDGAVLIEAAKRGIKAVGYEINPLVYLLSVVRCHKYGNMIQIKLGNMWRADLSVADGVYIFGIGRYMCKFDAKLAAELPEQALVASYAFELPRKAIRRNGAVFVYQYQGSGVANQAGIE